MFGRSRAAGDAPAATAAAARGLLRPAVLRSLAVLAALTAVVAVGPAGAEPAPVEPVFVDGQAQAVFSTNTATWIRQELWVETEVDSDFDGNPDRIHVDVTRVQETATEGLKVPVVMEVSPYYAGGSGVTNWPVDHEIGFPPDTKPPWPPRNYTQTSPRISSAHESNWVPRGFAVVHAEGLGTGYSTGCPTSGGRNETLGPKAVVDWLNGRAKGYTTQTGTTETTADWTTGKVGMIGTSYNGTLPIGVASTGVQGLEAIVPISAISSWYDYYRANGAVRAPGGFQGEDLDVLADYTHSRRDSQAICQPVIDNLRAIQDRATGDYSPIWDERNYMNDVDKVKAASLVAHGNNDWNVMTKHAAEYYNALKARGVPAQLYWHQGGHGGSPPLGLLNRWFTRYLWGVQNGVENDPKAFVVREPDQCPPRNATVVGDQANTTTLFVNDTSPYNIGLTLTIPQTNSTGTITNTTRVIGGIRSATELVLTTAVATAAGQKVADGATVSMTCSAANPSPYPQWPQPGTSGATLNFGAGGAGIAALTFRRTTPAPETIVDNATITPATLMNAATSPHRLVFKTEPLSAPIRISGTPTISLDVAFSKPKANLTAHLISYPGGTGNGTVISRGWIDPENRTSPAVTEPITPGTTYRLRFDMQPKDSQIAAGRRLGIMILSSDRDYTVRPAPGTELTVDLAASSVTLPIVGGAVALAQATGVTAPSIGSTLDPATPNGANGWYSSGNVALTWQVDDGGAAVTKTGCVDEVFATDGTFTRSCSASNLLGSAGPASVTVKRDVTPPSVSVTGVSDGAVYVLGTAPAAGCATTDATSGVAKAATVAVTGGTSGVGFFTATCSGAEDVAGNTGQKAATYQVVYDWTGFGPPIENRGSNPNAGSAVPVKFQLAGFHGLGVLAAGSPSFQQTSCTTGAAIGSPSPTQSAEPFSYDQLSSTYVYVWKTNKYQAGTCGRLDVTLIDGTTHSTSFHFTK